MQHAGTSNTEVSMLSVSNADSNPNYIHYPNPNSKTVAIRLT